MFVKLIKVVLLMKEAQSHTIVRNAALIFVKVVHTTASKEVLYLTFLLLKLFPYMVYNTPDTNIKKHISGISETCSYFVWFE